MQHKLSLYFFMLEYIVTVGSLLCLLRYFYSYVCVFVLCICLNVCAVVFVMKLVTIKKCEASKWPNDNSDRHNPDIYDCRTRPWYTAAANSPKNIVILQDVSGSMTGLRREIAKHVIYTIMDTLTDNDYVSVLNFTDYTSPVVPCFKDDLVQVSSIFLLNLI